MTAIALSSPPATDPAIEASRLAKLLSFDLLDTAPEAEFDAITRLAQRLIGCPVALISLVDDRRQWFKARCGVDADGTPRDQAFCAHAMLGETTMVVENAMLDPRFAANPLVTGPLGIRFYAGVPLRPRAIGFDDSLPGIGTLCVIDTKPRSLSDEEMAQLDDLAMLVTALIEARSTAAQAVELSAEARERAMALDSKQRLLLQAERMAGIGSWRLDLSDMSVEWSDQVFAIHDLPVGTPPAYDEAMSFYTEADRAIVNDSLALVLEGGPAFAFESDIVTAAGRRRRVRSMGEPEVVDGRQTAVIGVFQDITELHAREEALRESASTDALTGLANRRAFEVAIERAMARATCAGEPLALLILDLDGFKAVNDSFGHDAGDEVLRAMAARLRSRDCANAFAARLGGDEFVLLVTRPRDCADLDGFVATMLRRMRYDIVREGELKRVSATIGAAMLGEGVTTAELMRAADLALYEAKRFARGTGRIHARSDAILARGTRVVTEFSKAA